MKKPNRREYPAWIFERESIQYLSQQRARINPLLVPSLCHWIFAFRARFTEILKLTGRGYSKTKRKWLRGQKDYARRMLALCDALEHMLYETVDARLVDESRRAWEAATVAIEESM